MKNTSFHLRIHNVPKIEWNYGQWNDGIIHTYLSQLLGKVPHRCEHSHNNHFMYFNKPHGPRTKKKRNNNQNRKRTVPDNWNPPTELLYLPFDDFMEKAKDEENWSTESQHWYYRLIGCGNDGQCVLSCNTFVNVLFVMSH